MRATPRYSLVGSRNILEDIAGAQSHEDPQPPGYMVAARSNYRMKFRVDDLHALLAELRGAGVHVDAPVEDSEYGRLGCRRDPAGQHGES